MKYEAKKKAHYHFEVKGFDDKWGVFSYGDDPIEGKYDIVFDTYDRAVAAKEIIEHWYQKGRAEGDGRNAVDDGKGTK